MEGRTATLKESVLAELFADADKLIGRIEAVEGGLGVRLGEAQRLITEAVQSATVALASSAGAEREKWTREARSVTAELVKASEAVAGQRRGIVPTMIGVGLGSGAFGGLIVALVFKL